jgi:hypothetical protein
MYQTIFLRSRYCCNNFGHKAINCKAYAKNKRKYEGHPRINHLRKPHEAYNKNYNNFGSLKDKVECYKCNNCRHMAKDCILTVPPKVPEKYFKYWLWGLIIFMIKRYLFSVVFIPHEDFTPRKNVHSSTRKSAGWGYPPCRVQGGYPFDSGVWGKVGP